MKSLVQYIRESSEESVASSKTFTFNFSGIDGAEDFIKSVNEFDTPESVNVEVEENTVKVTVNKDAVDDAEGLFELMQDFIELRRKDQKNASSESYAIKTDKLMKTLNDWRDYVDDVALADEDDDDDKSEDDKSDDDKSEDDTKDESKEDKNDEE